MCCANVYGVLISVRWRVLGSAGAGALLAEQGRMEVARLRMVRDS